MNVTGDTIPKRFQSVASLYPNHSAAYSKNSENTFVSTTFHEFYRLAAVLGSALHDFGVKRGDHIGIIADNREEWMLTDIAVLGIGAIDVPRGSDSTAEEISFILAHADCRITFAENAVQAEKIISKIASIPLVETIILYDDGKKDVSLPTDRNIEVYTFSELLQRGEQLYAENEGFFDAEVAKGRGDETATLIYTSGTTGEPKGVMLTHTNFIFQVERIYEHIDVLPGHIFISVLPIWHSFERAVEYVVFNRAASIAYSKPIGKIMLEDMGKMKPQWMASVPRIWEGVRSAVYRNVNNEGGIKKSLFYFFVGVGEAFARLKNLLLGRAPQFKKRSRVLDALVSIIPLILLVPLKLLGNALVFKKLKARLGGEFIAGISGGGALPDYVDKFFQAAGILLLEGYGLTETAPILSVRKQKKPVSGTVGPLLKDIEYRLVNEQNNDVGPGKKGVLWVKSDQVMKGYYKRPDATDEVLKDGWLNTGDIAMFTHTGEFTIIGREKETIVLMGGENVEPTPIEDKLKQSDFIDQVMVIGQDKKYLAALINPNQEKLEATAQEYNIQYVDWEELCTNPQIQNLVNTEVQNLINSKTGFKSFERIFKFILLPKPFEVGKEMTRSMKIKRNVVEELYKKEIKHLFE
jgi:long-chain acyl-CoA synthetase